MNPLHTDPHHSENSCTTSVRMSLSSLKSSHTTPTNDTSAWLSIFIGDPFPASPRLDHIRLPTRAPKQIFNSSAEGRNSPTKASSFNTTTSASLRQHDASKELSIFCTIVSLTLACEQALLYCVNNGTCVVCQAKAVQSFVFRPLCATKHGYGELTDFGEMHRLMMTIASHTTHITRRDEASWSIGSFLSDQPYICVLAIPVCLGDSRCRRVAAERSQGYIAGILDGTVQAHTLKDGPAIVREKVVHTAEIHTADSTPRGANSKTSSPGIIFNLVDSDRDRFRTIGATVFICGSDLQSTKTGPLNLVGCIVLSSRWPQTMLPDSSRNETHKTSFYQNITKHYERKILEHVDSYCAVCRPTIATKLVHVPLLFLGTNRKTSDEQLARSVVMNLCRLFSSHWKFPEVKSALGADCDAQVFALVVPVCMETVCAEVADASARMLIQSALPCGLRLPEIGSAITEQQSATTSYPDQETVHVRVKKLVGDFPVESSNARQDAIHTPMVGSHTEHQRQIPRNARNLHNETNRSGASEEQNHQEEDEVWIYRAEKGMQRCASDEACLAAEDEQVSLFQPLLNIEFWLLHGEIAMQYHSTMQRARRNSV